MWLGVGRGIGPSCVYGRGVSMPYEAPKIVIFLYRTARPLAVYVGEVSSFSRAYSTARSKGIALPSAQAFSNSSGLSISRALVR